MSQQADHAALGATTLDTYDELRDPFRNLTEGLSTYNKLKFIFPGLISMPIRLTCGMSCVILSAAILKITTLGLKKGSGGKPLRGWRRLGPWCVHRLSRGLLFFLGFHRIKVNGKPAPATEAPIVVSNHVAPWEGFALMHLCGATFVSRHENVKIPVFGTCIKGLQSIVVNRDEATSRDAVTNEIRRRATEPGWPVTGIFPEGTVSNGKFLLQFRAGAFQAGVAVQPVLVHYRFRYCDPSWAGVRVGLGALALRLVTQFYNSMEVTFLPVYHPSEEEKHDPILYATNVRRYMSENSKGVIGLSNYSIEDYIVLMEAKRFGIGQSDAVIGVENLRRATNLSGSDIKHILRSFHNMDAENTGFISYEQFIKALGIPNSEPTRKSFRDLCEQGSDVISFRAFLQSVVHLSRDITTDDKLRMAFDIANVKGDGKITHDELAVVLSIIAPDMSGDSVKQLFRRIDTRRVGFIDFIEFGAFFRANPHYMQLFETARELERAKGQNAVLDMLKRREQGQQVTVAEFKASVEHYRTTHHE
jgi:lysophosphatidylcholine acyltransferase / lyso-PAF acetyltransferase